MKGFLTSRRFRQGTMATAITVVVVALIVVVNFVATTLTERYSLTLDLTPTKLFSITDATKDYLKGLDKDVIVYVMDTEESFGSRGEYYLQALEVLKKYALESGKITIEYVDLVSNPAFSQKYPTLQLSSSSILITCGDKVRDVTTSQLYDIESNQSTGQSRVAASKAEQVLTSAVLAVTSEKSIDVAVITGHNEASLSAFTSLLGSNNYLTGEHNILTEDIPSNYTVAVISAPQRDYEPEELQRLDRFLKNDGKYGKILMYFAHVQQPELPNLEAFLADWGIEIGSGVVVETDSSRSSPMDASTALLDYGESEYSQDLKAVNLFFIAAESRPVKLLFESKSSITTKSLVQFSSTAGIATAETTSLDQVEISGPIPALVMASSLTYEGTTPLTSHVIAGGTINLLNQQYLASTNYANSEYILNLLAELSGKEEDIRIQSKAIGNTELSITGGQAVGLGLALAVIFPLAVLISGIVIWARRRHR